MAMNLLWHLVSIFKSSNHHHNPLLCPHSRPLSSSLSKIVVVNKVEASTNQMADQQMSIYDLPSKILCRVINVQLKAVVSGIQSLNLSYSRSNSAAKFDGSSEPKSLDFREALFLIKEGTQVVESSCYIPLLQGCIARRSGWEAKIVHSHIVKTGTHQDSFLMTFLVNVYSKCGAMENARKVFDKLAKKNVVTWTALMTGYVHNSQPESATQLFLEILEAGGYPTNYSLVVVVSACSLLYSIELGKQIHAYSIKYQVDSDTSLGNSLCSLYSKCGRLERAVNAFRRIKL